MDNKEPTPPEDPLARLSRFNITLKNPDLFLQIVHQRDEAQEVEPSTERQMPGRQWHEPKRIGFLGSDEDVKSYVQGLRDEPDDNDPHASDGPVINRSPE